jgi:hypothetical protein
MNERVWAWVSIIVLSVLILGLIFVPTARQNQRGAFLVIVRSAEEPAPPAKLPPGGGLIVRRVAPLAQQAERDLP